MRYKEFRDSANILSLVVLAGWAIFTLLKASSVPGQPFGGDYGNNLQQSTQVLERHSFPYGFTYPLPCVLLRYYLFKIGGNYSGILWVCLIAFSLYFVTRFLVEEFYTGDARYRYLYLMLAFLPVSYYIQWDVRALNCNQIVLFLVMASVVCIKRKADLLSGLFLAMGTALKLYPVVILPYLLVKRKYRVVLSALAWIVIFFFIIPFAVLGGTDFAELTGKWMESIALTGAPDFIVKVVAYKTSLHYAILSLISNGDLSSLSAPSLGKVKQLIYLLKIFFALLGVVYLIFDLRRPALPKEVDHILFNTILIMLGSLLFSELLQPHHGVYLFAASLLIINFSLSGSFPKSFRYPVLALALLPGVIVKVAAPGMQKAFAMNLHIIVYILLFVFIRFYMTGNARTERISTTTPQSLESD
jgi:hypothetical protein